jgi:hypothetical protein
MPPSRNMSCSLVSATRFLATTSRPEVSRSSRWASSRNFASGRARRNCSMTPKDTPLPPCTATPEGLSTTMRPRPRRRSQNPLPEQRLAKDARRCGWAARAAGRQLQPVLGRHPALVHPYLAAAQDAVDVALGHALGDAQQEVVDALAFGLLADLKPCHRIFAQVLHFQYTAPLVSRPVTVCPAARSGVGGTVPGMLSPPLLSLSAMNCKEATNLRKHHQTAAGITNRPARKPRTSGYFARPKERYYLIARYTRTDLGTDCRTLIMSQRPPYRRQVINPVCHVKPKAP